jgi:hypothetical protein
LGSFLDEFWKVIKAWLINFPKLGVPFNLYRSRINYLQVIRSLITDSISKFISSLKFIHSLISSSFFECIN